MTQTTVSWQVQLTTDEQDEVSGVVDAATEADGVAPLSEQVVLALSRPAHRRPAGADSDEAFDAALRAAARHAPHLLARRHGVLVGYAHLDAPDPGAAEPEPAELVVHPEQRRKHVAKHLLEALFHAGPDVRVWAHGNREPAQRVAADLGLVPLRELWQMRRALDDDTQAVPDVPLSEGPLPQVPQRDDVVVRTYQPGRDDEAVLAVNNAAFAWHPEQGGWTADDLAERRGEEWFDPAGFFLATDAASGELLGFHWTKVHAPAGDDPALGEVYVVAISPDAQGRGLGRLLTLVGMHHLQQAGLPAVLLYVESDNTAAVHTYTRLGFAKYHVDVAYGQQQG